jgi:hypothetical protein
MTNLVFGIKPKTQKDLASSCTGKVKTDGIL